MRWVGRFASRAKCVEERGAGVRNCRTPPGGARGSSSAWNATPCTAERLMGAVPAVDASFKFAERRVEKGERRPLAECDYESNSGPLERAGRGGPVWRPVLRPDALRDLPRHPSGGAVYRTAYGRGTA